MKDMAGIRKRYRFVRFLNVVGLTVRRCSGAISFFAVPKPARFRLNAVEVRMTGKI